MAHSHRQPKPAAGRRRAVLAAASTAVVGALIVVGTQAIASDDGPDNRGPDRPAAQERSDAGTAKAGPSDAPAPEAAESATGWKLMWQPDPTRDGLGAFEGVEDDRAGSHPGTEHIRVVDGAYRFDMHMEDRDTHRDRQRNEVKGMHAGDRDLRILEGETWRFTYSMFIPDTLRATKSFTHIMQFKEPGNGTSPVITMSLRQSGGKPTLELNSFSSGKFVGRTALPPLQNKWITTQLDITFKDGTAGAIDWVVARGSTTAVKASAKDLDTWLGPERARPKWGIYRSLKDKPNLRDTYLLVKDLKAYRQTAPKAADSSKAPTAPAPSTSPSASRSGGSAPAATGLDDPRTKDFAMRLVSSAENSSLDWKAQYRYIEDIEDGRGYTGGIIGFCSGTGDMLDLVEAYTARKPGNALAGYLPALREVDGTDSHAGLDPGFTGAWRKAAADPVFQEAQNAERDRVYFDPAVRRAKKDGLRALGQFAYYDAIVMHGNGSDRESFGAIRRNAMNRARTPAQGGDETAYLHAFMDARKAAMKAEEAHSDTSRVDTAQRVFLERGNLDLRLPLRWQVYGDSFAIER